MSIFAKNRISLGVTYTDAGIFRLDANTAIRKLTVVVQGDSAILEVSQKVPPAFDQLNEMELLPGFHSRAFEEPVYGFRFRSRTVQGTTVTFVAQ